MSRAFAIAVVLVIHNRRVLVGHRPLAAVSAAGAAEFPGGKLEPGETAAAAARRECWEETGLDVVIDDLIATGQVAETGGQIDFFSGRLAAGEQTPAQSPFHWLTPAEVAACRFPPANAAAVAWLMRQLSQQPPPNG